jgi:hypothetical protein
VNIDWLIGLTRIRLGLIFAGLAGLIGIDVPFWMRLQLVLLFLVATALDGYVEKVRLSHPTKTTTVPPQRSHV